MKRTAGFFSNFYPALRDAESGYEARADARFLAISDMHGANRFDFVRAILQHERAEGRRLDAVLILGDMVNFGCALELRIHGFRRALESLGVPVLVVLGNHDKHKAQDTSLERFLEAIPNVHVMQTRNHYTFLRFNGVVVAGFNDPRYFGDSPTGAALKQKPALAAFNKVVLNRGQDPDIVMVHEPYAAGLPPSLWLNGHMHSPALDEQGNRAQVGMFAPGVRYYNRKKHALAHARVGSSFLLIGARLNQPTTILTASFRWRSKQPLFESLHYADTLW